MDNLFGGSYSPCVYKSSDTIIAKNIQLDTLHISRLPVCTEDSDMLNSSANIPCPLGNVLYYVLVMKPGSNIIVLEWNCSSITKLFLAYLNRGPNALNIPMKVCTFVITSFTAIFYKAKVTIKITNYDTNERMVDIYISSLDHAIYNA
jgi:hypothetical protein